jgi:hypothetical protein
MRKRSRATGGLPVDSEVVLLRPRLQPLSSEQHAEAVELLSDLLLAAARLSRNGEELATVDGDSRQEPLAA